MRSLYPFFALLLIGKLVVLQSNAATSFSQSIICSSKAEIHESLANEGEDSLYEEIPIVPLCLESSVIADQGNDSIYSVVDQQPQYPGGEAALMSAMKRQMKWEDAIAKDSTILSCGRFVCSFIVEKDGTLSNFEFLKGPESSREVFFDFVKSMPAWIPGKQDDMPVRVKYILPFCIHWQ